MSQIWTHITQIQFPTSDAIKVKDRQGREGEDANKGRPLDGEEGKGRRRGRDGASAARHSVQLKAGGEEGCWGRHPIGQETCQEPGKTLGYKRWGWSRLKDYMNPRVVVSNAAPGRGRRAGSRNLSGVCHPISYR